MRTCLLFVFVTFYFVNVFGANRYWVGGAGNWSDNTNHWSATSGGAPGASVPGIADNAIFDAFSGLTVITTVNIDAPVTVVDLDFSGVPVSFTFNNAGNDITLTGSLNSNGSGVVFAGAWGEIIMNAALAGETITSGATIWVQDFRIGGLQVALNDDLNLSTATLFVDDGGIDLSGFDLVCGSFDASVANVRTIDITGSTLTVALGTWNVNGTTLTLNSNPSTIFLGDLAGNATFTGGGMIYDTLRSTSASVLNYFDGNAFSLFQAPISSTLNVNDGDGLATDSLLFFGTCALPATIQANPGVVNASITKSGFPVLNLAGVDIIKVDATAGPLYNLAAGSVVSAAGWSVASANFYWVGNTGNWNDGSHWAFTSGGIGTGCIPTSVDSVFFDANSFSLASQTVTVDDTAFFLSMDWTGIVGAQTLALDSSMFAFGDVTFDPNLSLIRNEVYSGILFNEAANLDPANATLIDCSFLITMSNSALGVDLLNDLVMTDTSSILVFNGQFDSQSNDITTGTFQTVNNPFDGADQRTLTFGSSTVELKLQFNSWGDTVLVLNAGTSQFVIGDTLEFSNNLITEGETFYDVRLNFEPRSIAQKVAGNNNFHKFEVLAGSELYVQTSSVQTVSDSLILRGNCRDSIFISTLDTLTFVVADLNKTGVNTNVVAECLNLQGIDATGLALTSYFSTDLGANNNITFSTLPSATAHFEPDSLLSSFCFGDTVFFTNNSTAFSGNFNDLSFNWYFNDGSTGYYLNPPVDSTYITFEPDTNRHQFLQFDSINVVLEATYTNFCTDLDTFRIDIIHPNISLLTTESDTTLCPWEAVTHEAFSAVPGTTFEFFYNGVSQNVPTVNDTLFTVLNMTDLDTVGVLAYEQGCVSDTMPAFVYTVFPAPIFSWTSSDLDQSICIGDGVSFNAWSADSLYEFGFLVNGVPTTVFMDSVGDYTTSSLLDNDIVYVVGLDSNNCTDTLNMTFNVDPLPGTTLSESNGGNVICAGQAVTFTAAGADTYEFFVNSTSVQGPSASNTYVNSGLTATDTVRVMGINLNGCLKMAPEEYVYIINPSPPTALGSSDADNSICSGTPVTFTASGAAIYEFLVNGLTVQGPSPTSTYNTSGLSNGDAIEVIGTFSGCSSTTPAINMIVLASPTTTLINDDDGDNTICAGTTVTFTAGGATNYEFFVNGISQGAPSGTINFVTSTLTNGQTVMVQGESNTCIVSQQHVFTVLNNPNVNMFSSDADNIICQSAPITFTGVNAAQYEFFVNGFSVQGPAPASTLVNPALLNGANTIQVVGTAGNGCTDPSSVINLTVNAIPTILVSSSDFDNTICAGESVTFTSNGGDMYQFFVNGTPQGAMSPTNTFVTSGLLNGQIVSVNGSMLGCPDASNTIATVVNPVPPTSLTSDDVDNSYCSGDLVTYTATGANNYEFLVGGVSQGPSSPVNTINSSGFSSGSFSVQVIGESNNCYSNSTLNITVNTLPTAGISSSDADNVICAGDDVTYTATGGVLYEFFINGASQGTVSPTDAIDLSSLSNGDIVSVEVSSGAGCQDIDTYAPITVSPIPTVLLGSSDIDQQICLGDNVDFTASGATDYEFFINGISQGAPSPTNTLSTTSLSNGDNISVEGSAFGCSSVSGSLNFTVFGAPVVFLSNNDDSQLCIGENADLVAAGANNYQFLVNGIPLGPFSPVNTFTSPLNDGDVITVNGETNGCSALSAMSEAFVVYNYPTITSSSSDADNIICLNDLISFNASGAMEYDFSLNGSSQQLGATTTFDISTLQNGDVVGVTGYNGDCPSATDNYVFTVNSMNLGLTVAASSLICDGESVTFTATGADQYEFFLNGISQGAMSGTNTFTSSTLNDLDEVTFTGYSTSTLCTQPYEDYTIMNVIDAPTITPISAISFCDGDSVVLVSNASYGNQWYLDGSPIVGANDTNYVAYTSGNYSLEVTGGGTGEVWSFGHNANGNFGNGDNLNHADPTAAISSEQFDELSSGYEFLLGVTGAGDVYAWGENNSGQLGNGTYTSSNLPIQVPTLSGIKTVATAESSSMAVTNAGEVYVWGNNTSGQLATGNTAVINFPFLNAALTNVDSIAGGRAHFVLLKNDGTVWTVGDNSYGQLGQGNLTISYAAIQVPGLSNVVSVGAGEYHSFAIDNLGDLYVWGNNGSGQLGLGDLNNRLNPTLSTLRNVVNAQGGANHSAFLTNAGEVFTSGGNTFGQLGLGAPGNTTTPVQVTISGAKMISVGQYTTLVNRNDMSVFGFGNNTEDQLSSPSGLTVAAPEHISDVDGANFIEASRYSSHFIYNANQTCASSGVTVNVLSAPPVSITPNVDTLVATAGVSYQWFFNGNPIPGAMSQSYEANNSGNYYVEVTFASGCVGASPVYYHSMTGLNLMGDLTFQLYPNPASEVVRIDLGKPLQGNMEIIVSDQSGRSIYKVIPVSGNQLIEISISGLSNGVYYLALKSNNHNGTARFVKQSN